MVKKLLSIMAVICIFSNISAQITVTSTPGTLGEVVQTQHSNLSLVTSLTVNGTMDARDFRFIRDNLTNLVSLDLSAVTIVAYSGISGTNCNQQQNASNPTDFQTDYAANAVPDFAFFKRWITGSPFDPVQNGEKMTKLATLALPVNATQIGDYAFAGLPLSSINLSSLNNVTSIGGYAFYKSGITSITFPGGLKTLGRNVVTFCSNLQTVNFPASLESIDNTSGFFEGCLALSVVNFAEPAHISVFPLRFFYSNPSDGSLTLPNLQTVTVPSSVTNVSTAFENFIGTSIECDPDNPVFESIGGVLYKKADHSFVALAKSITSFTVPATMTVIADKMFENCTKLTTVTIESQLTKIGDKAFYSCPITSFNFQSTLTEIGEYAFYDTKLSTVNLTNNALLKTVKANVFAQCRDITTANLSGLDTLGIRMFQGCTALKSVTLSENLKTISVSAFSSCSALEAITIPNSVKTINGSAFMDCRKLVTINMPAGLITLGDQAFSNDTLITNLNLPAGFRDFTVTTSGSPFSNTYITVTVNASNPYFSAENGMLLNKTKTKLVYVPAPAVRKAVVIPAGVETVGNSAFRYSDSNRKIYKLTLPASLKNIENYGLYSASCVDTLVVKSVVPPGVENPFYSLNSRWGNYRPVILIPIRTKEAYIAAPGWSYYYDPTGANGNGIYDAFVQSSAFYDLTEGMGISVSPNGNFVVSNGANSGLLFKVRTGEFEAIPNSYSMEDVNDKGFIAGKFYDNNYPFNGYPITNSGVYRNGKWYTLGLGRYGNVALSAEAKSDVTCIDSAGNAYGASYLKESAAKIVPFAWKYNKQNDSYLTDTMAYASPVVYSAGDQGAKIQDISSDGKIAAGWVSRMVYGGSRSAIGWTTPTQYRLFDEGNPSEAGGVSPNGRYITTTKNNRAAVYDIEQDSVIIFGPNNSRATAVSDNGFVIGFQQRGDVFESGRQGFVWSEKLGFTYFRDFIDKYAPNVEIPAGEFFKFPKDRAIFDVPMSISADGMVIAGWSGYSALATHGWVLCLAEALDLIDRPQKLTASVDIPKRNSVNLSWTAPTDYGTHTLDWFYVYRNGKYIGRIEEQDGTTYTDNNAPTGNVIYQVTAVFDYKTSSNYLESSFADAVTVTIVDNYNLPFTEDFESKLLTTNYWTAEGNQTSAWIISDTGSINSVCQAKFIGGGDSRAYNLSLISKPFDAAGQNKIILAYMYQVMSNVADGDWVGKRDTVHVEIGLGNTWSKVASVLITEETKKAGWTPVTLDISPAAANKLFSVRFRAVSGANRNTYNFNVDNIGLSYEESATPSGVIAYRYNNKQEVNVLYKDVTGSYGLSYTNGILDLSIGNEGMPIIAVNRYTSQELKPLAGKYLTSVSAFLFGDWNGTETPTELKLAVFKNGSRIESAEISSFNGHAWNTFNLTTPLLIDGTEELLVGIEAFYGDAYNRPLSMDAHVNDYNPNANLYSEDDGATWLHTSDVEIYGNWGIKANFRDENTAATIDDDLFDVIYQVYRNDILVKSLQYGQHFVDASSTGDTDCYKIKVFRSLGGMSAISESGCGVQVISGLKDVKVSPVSIYPNPAKNFVEIQADVETVKIYNAQGKLMIQTNDSRIDVSKLSKGLYLFDVTLTDGSYITERIIVE